MKRKHRLKSVPPQISKVAQASACENSSVFLSAVRWKQVGEKWGLTILSQGADILVASTPLLGAGGQNGLSPLFAPRSNPDRLPALKNKPHRNYRLI